MYPIGNGRKNQKESDTRMDYRGLMYWPRSPRHSWHGPARTRRVVWSDICHLWNSDQFIYLCACAIGAVGMVVVEGGTFSGENDGVSLEMAVRSVSSFTGRSSEPL